MSANSRVADILYEISEIFTIKGDRYRSRAYSMASQRIRGLPNDIITFKDEGRLSEIPGIGAGISQVIIDYLETGVSAILEDLRESLPMGIMELMELEGIGPRIAFKLHDELGIVSVELLEQAARAGKISKLKGFGKKKEVNILNAIESHRSKTTRFLLGAVLPVIQDVLEYLGKLEAVIDVEIAGSARRKKETVGDLDLLVSSHKPESVIDHFIRMPPVIRVLQKGDTKSTVVLERQLQVDLRVIPPEVYGAALQYFTGSKEHNVKVRTIGVREGYKLSEYGLFNRDTDERVAADSEKKIYNRLGMDWIPPELRENTGEIEAALQHNLPRLVELNDIHGDLHLHTNWSDGSESIEGMAKKGIDLGWDYIAITDHSKSLGIANGLDEFRLKKQLTEIHKINQKNKDFTILSGIECNILAEGKLDLPNSVLNDLDWVIASIHTGLRQDEETITNRLIKAMRNPYVNAIGHPTGRLIQRRKPYDFNIDAVFSFAAKENVVMEINSFPNRLDLSAVNARTASKYGVLISIGTDSHDPSHMEFFNMGLGVARRGWLETKDLVNALTAEEVKTLRK